MKRVLVGIGITFAVLVAIRLALLAPSGVVGLPEFIVLGTIVALVVWAMRRVGASTAGAKYCPNCGSVGVPRRRTKGSFLIEVILWLCFLVPGLIYSVWRLTSREDVCASCGATNVIPVDSPKARAALATMTNVAASLEKR